MDGRWKGSAIIDTVNGKSVSVPDIDLVLQLYTDGLPGSHLMRGIIDSRESLLWPLDGQLLRDTLWKIQPGALATNTRAAS